MCYDYTFHHLRVYCVDLHSMIDMACHRQPTTDHRPDQWRNHSNDKYHVFENSRRVVILILLFIHPWPVVLILLFFSFEIIFHDMALSSVYCVGRWTSKFSKLCLEFFFFTISSRINETWLIDEHNNNIRK